MSLFQNSVLKKYLRALDHTAVEAAWQRYTTHFFDPQYQHNVRAAKEEQYQEGFLRDLFVNILGYTLHPKPGFDLTTELKNIRGAKKTDGAILQDGHAVAVIELKGTDTVSLDKIEDQAFGYKRNQTNCTYVITSNFEKLRFYIDDSIDFIDFPLFQLTKDEFDLLYLCLSKDSIRTDLPKRIKSESVTQEEAVTKQLYKDYSAFRREIFDSIVQRNPEHDKLTLFKSTQKLLDRFLFIFFAEDRGLLPPNSIRQIIVQWTDLRDKYDEYTPLYERFKKYFGYLNTGHKGTKHEIFAYNGGLFTTDELLDSILIDDDILYAHTQRLSDYDFESEVSVNILGHIFEHSLNEIEEIQSELEGQELDKAKTKRKKDGVFYTPKYITKYIVDNTVGRLCEEKKAALNIDEAEYEKDRKGRPVQKLKTLQQQLEDYRSWLLELTICDPACGSGAFLNQALEYLIAEHQYIDTLQTKLLGGGFTFPNVENAILEHNLYGVDINEESVEIAKLSLWLRTAERGRKLTSLNDNIKCGNSLIDDAEVAGDKAFKWQEEFPEVFEKGGFDVVIGNPPYVSAIELKKSSSKEEYEYLKENYNTAKGTVDLYIYFFEKGYDLCKEHALLAFITPNRYLSASYGLALRNFILDNCQMIQLVDYSDKKVFPDASTYPVITFLKCSIGINYNVSTGKFDEETKLFSGRIFPSSQLRIIENNILGFLLNDKLPITEKVISQSTNLNDVGLINATSTAKEADEYSTIINEEGGYMLINTGTIDPFKAFWGLSYLTDKGKKYFKPYLSKSSDIISGNRHALYSNPKIIISKIGLRCEAFFDRNGSFASINTNCLHSFNEGYITDYILCWLNSKLYNYVFECLFDGLRMSGGYLLYSAPNLKNTYIKKLKLLEQEPFTDLAKNIEGAKERYFELKQSFNVFLQVKFNLETLTKKLENWYELSFGDFLQELKKKKVILTLSEEAEWMPYFEEQRAAVQEIRTQIDRIDAEIDQMVYELYGLTDEEIAIVEEAVG